MVTGLHFKALVIIGLSFFQGSLILASPDVNLRAQPRLPDKPAHEISLLTFSPTDNLFEWFGHTALAVKNHRTGQSIAYSFGGFSFQTRDFLMFAMGQFTFWSYTDDAESLVGSYRKKGRHIIIQHLDLTRKQSLQIRRRLRLAMLPQNRLYIYDHFKDNCATRLRDIVNEALDGAVKNQSSYNTGNTVRNYIDRMTGHLPALNFLLNFVLSDGVDRDISHWETMFLPDRLMAVFQKTINPKTGRPLVKIRKEITGKKQSPFFADTATIYQTGKRDWTFGLTGGFLLAAAAFFYLKKADKDELTGAPLQKVYPTAVACFGTLFGFLGVVLFFMTVIASHKDVYWNENFFLINPLTLALLPLGLLRFFGRTRTAFATVSLLCGFAGLTGFLLKLLPAFDQGNGQQIRMLLPMLLVIGVTGMIDLIRLRTASVE